MKLHIKWPLNFAITYGNFCSLDVCVYTIKECKTAFQAR